MWSRCGDFSLSTPGFQPEEMTVRTRTTVTPHHTADMLARHEMLTPALLLLAGHRPLAFVVGQLLYGLAPVAALFGLAGCQDWARLLSDPHGAAQLQQALEDAASDRDRRNR